MTIYETVTTRILTQFAAGVIRDAVQLPGRHTSAFSKYAACRVYG